MLLDRNGTDKRGMNVRFPNVSNLDRLLSGRKLVFSC